MTRAALLGLCLLVASPAMVHGAEPSADALASGKREFERGVALLQDAKYAEAAAALERSVAAFESPSALYNLGLAYRGLGAYKRAIATLKRFLVLATAQHADLREGAQRILPELRASLAHVALSVRGSPEAVVLDGEPLAIAKPGAPTFEAELVLDPGTHEVTVTRHGFQPVKETITALQPGERRDVVLEAAKARVLAELVVDPDVEGAIVRVDGTVRGAGSTSVTLEPGPHTIDVTAEGYEPATRTVTLEPGARERFGLTLLKSEPSLFGRWWFWAGVTAVAGAAIAGAVILAQPKDPTYDGGTFGFTLQN